MAIDTSPIFFLASKSQPGIFLTHFRLRILRIVCHVDPLLSTDLEINYYTTSIAR
jgi:hypothetical protein